MRKRKITMNLRNQKLSKLDMERIKKKNGFQLKWMVFLENEPPIAQTLSFDKNYDEGENLFCT